MKVCFTVPGPPRTWKRVNMFNGIALTDKKARDHKHLVAWHAKKATMSGGTWLSDKAQRFSVVIQITEKDGRRGDLDNYAKAILDACNGVLWADDRQVDSLAVFRCEPNANDPHTYVSVVRTAAP